MDTSKACCSVPMPEVVATDYVAKGTYDKISGVDVYITGSPSATKGIIDVYDAFGISPPTLQGADIIASALNAIVLVPDFFKGNAAQSSWFPADTKEKEELVSKWFASQGNFEDKAATLIQIAKEAAEKYPSVSNWGAFGLCWGGKVCALASAEGTPFKAVGQVHPGRMAVEDAEKIVVPHIVLASKGEPTDVVSKYAEILGKNGEVETYPNMHHGWMGARAKLAEEEFKKEYERGYKQLANFFARYL